MNHKPSDNTPPIAKAKLFQTDNEAMMTHDALIDRGQPLNVEVVTPAPTDDADSSTHFVETIGHRQFTIPMIRGFAVMAVRQMLAHHPMPAKVDGKVISKRPFDAQQPYVNLIGSRGPYPEQIVLSQSMRNKLPGMILLDGVAYQYQAITSSRSQTELTFNYMVADQAPEPNHPNCRRVRMLNGTPNLNAAAEPNENAAGPAAMMGIHTTGTIDVHHGLMGSPLKKQAQAQQQQTEEDFPPLAPETTIYQLWEPDARDMEKLQNSSPDEWSRHLYLNMCVLENEDQATYPAEKDERQNAAMAYAMWSNPQLGLTPVMPMRKTVKPSATTKLVNRRATLERAVAVTTDGQTHDLMTQPTSQSGFVQRVDAIELTIQVSEPDGSTRNVVTPAPVYFHGVPGKEQIWAAPACNHTLSQEKLASMIENAYWYEGWPMANCEEYEPRKERTMALANRCSYGDLFAFKQEIQRAATRFNPVAPFPTRPISAEQELPDGGKITVSYRPPEAE